MREQTYQKVGAKNRTKPSAFSLGLIAAMLVLALHQNCFAQNPRPNIVWIVAEDISPFLGCYGNPELRTPNIDKLSAEGVRFTSVHTVAGVCAVSRSGIITGMYPTSIGTQNMRTSGGSKFQPVPQYSAVIPDYVHCFPEYLRKIGYYCTNNAKQDYQFTAPVTVWDENGITASWRNRPNGAPFFSVFNFAVTHESQLFTETNDLTIDPAYVHVPPIYPNTEEIRRGIAHAYSNIEKLDKQVGELIALLKNDGLYETTMIWFYSDHGGPLPWMKREVLDRGTHIPLIIRFPNGEKAGTIDERLISSIDFAPTILSIVGIPVPPHLHGEAFIPGGPSRTFVFATRDRMDTEYDRVRSVRDKRYQYLYNYMPEKPYYQDVKYRLDVPMMKEILRLKSSKKLSPDQMAWFGPKPLEELYDLETDPYELRNLAKTTDLFYDVDRLVHMRQALQEWATQVGDKASIPEKKMIDEMWEGKNHPPETAKPEITPLLGGVKIACKTKGASIGYRIVQDPATEPAVLHEIMTWDFESLTGEVKNGTKIPSAPVWQVYEGQLIVLKPGETIYANALRIGFKSSQSEYKAP